MGKYGTFGQLKATVSPLWMPTWVRTLATWLAAAFTAAYDSLVPSKMPEQAPSRLQSGLPVLERAGIDLAGHPAVVPQVIKQVTQTVHGAGAPGFQEAFERFWIECTIAGCQGIGEQG